jgi:hypothetical protein
MSTQLIDLKQASPTRMLGMRQTALPLRGQIETAIAAGAAVAIDFSQVEATQSFIDELIGVLIGIHGPSILERITFTGCSSTVKGILQFVAADRAGDYLKRVH